MFSPWSLFDGLKPSSQPKRFWLALAVCLIIFLVGLMFVSIGRR